MTLDELKRAIKIFEKYAPNASLRAEHDQVWTGPDDDVELSTEDERELDALGWFRDEGGWSHFA